MKRMVQIGDTDVSYIIKRRKRSRSMSLRVVGADVVVGAPPYVSIKDIHAFITQQYPWILNQKKRLEQKGAADVHATSRVHFERYKQRALALAHKKVRAWNEQYQFEYVRISVKNMHTRWGSCSEQGNISFHYKILFLPESLQDYLVVHELCHLREMNHGPRFWALVSQTIPDYKTHRIALKRI